VRSRDAESVACIDQAGTLTTPMPNSTAYPRVVRRLLVSWLLGAVACSPAPDEKEDAGVAMSAMTGGMGAIGSGGAGPAAPAGTGGSGTGGKSAAGSGGATGTGGSSAAPVDAGHHDAAVHTDAGALDAGPPDAGMSNDAMSYADGLNELFIDAPCASNTPTPLAQAATCQHPPNTQRIEKPVAFGGDPAITYDVKLRVRGIFEPTTISGGQRPYMDTPFTVGGMVASGVDPINYQQYFIKVSKPAQTYWLNDYQYVAHDIHKADYEATIQVAGAADVTVVMNDGNDHEIANWTKDYFMGLEPYASAPSLGQMLRLDVISVSAH
jgi:hypothetical protein